MVLVVAWAWQPSRFLEVLLGEEASVVFGYRKILRSKCCACWFEVDGHVGSWALGLAQVEVLFHAVVADVIVFVVVVVKSEVRFLLGFLALIGDRVNGVVVILWTRNLVHDILVHEVRLFTEANSNLVVVVVELLGLLVEPFVQHGVLMRNFDMQLFQMLRDAKSLVFGLRPLEVLEGLVGLWGVEGGWRR